LEDTQILSDYQPPIWHHRVSWCLPAHWRAWEYHHVDNIAVTTIAAPVPPVSVTNSPATSIQTTSATLGGSIAGGNIAGVTIFYGRQMRDECGHVGEQHLFGATKRGVQQ